VDHKRRERHSNFSAANCFMMILDIFPCRPSDQEASFG
jgi:hypothetical protein